MKAVTDEQLIRWVADGDPSCLATLFERHHRAVYQYLLQMLRDRALCEDLVQDVFLKVLRKAGHFHGDGSFKAWLFNIARNLAFDQMRKAKRRDSEALDEDVMEPELADNRSAEHVAAGSQKVKRVLAAMAKLLGSEMQGKLLDEFLQLHGGYGFMSEYKISRAWVDARVARIYGGTSEIMKEIIGRNL